MCAQTPKHTSIEQNTVHTVMPPSHLHIKPRPITPKMLSTRPHQNVVWYNNSWLGFLKILNYVPKEREKYTAKNEPSFVTVKCCNGSYELILGEIICESSNWQHIQRLKITILGANWQLFRLERIAKCSYFILSTQWQNIKFHWIVMKIKKFLLPSWWYNRDLFPLRNKYNVVFVLNGIRAT